MIAASKSESKDTNYLGALSDIPTDDKERSRELAAMMDNVMRGVDSNPDMKKALEEAMKAQSGPQITPEASEITPLSGFVIKTTLSKSTPTYPSGFKVFINVCHSPYCPAPPLATDKEIREAIAASNEGTTPWRVPMSLVGPRDDIDKVGRPCVIFDACVHSDVVDKAEGDWEFKVFVIELALEWLEQKHSMALSRDFALPKMKAKGALGTHKIYRPKRAGVSTAVKQQPLYQVKQVGRTLKVHVKLPLLQTSAKIDLEIEDRKIELTHSLYHLSLPLSMEVDVESPICDAVFDKTTRVLSITLPIITQ